MWSPQKRREGEREDRGQGRFGFGLLNLSISANVCCLEDTTRILEYLLRERNSDAVKQQHCMYDYTITHTVCRM
jgi:hypothetical protein